ncbi:hypothetical protein B0T19DRAFT_400754 [Cercophora scortea]|uniref:Uncharacterized protein n=1 Tax=Cercophora scortea TaxID=314031 RepID=A0AAE0MD94_9PEZI|nr:hypothetical protein B0T19DRAFT_400754 [Cercophora scortea]
MPRPWELPDRDTSGRGYGGVEDDWDAEAQWLQPRMFPAETYADYVPEPAPAPAPVGTRAAGPWQEEVMDKAFTNADGGASDENQATEGQVYPPGGWNEENPWAKPYPWLPVSDASDKQEQAGPSQVSKGKERAVNNGEHEPQSSSNVPGPANLNEARGNNLLVPDSNSGRQGQAQPQPDTGNGKKTPDNLSASPPTELQVSPTSSSPPPSPSAPTGKKRKPGRPPGVKNSPKYDENGNVILSAYKRMKLKREAEEKARQEANTATAAGPSPQPSKSAAATIVVGGQTQGQEGIPHHPTGTASASASASAPATAPAPAPVPALALRTHLTQSMAQNAAPAAPTFSPGANNAGK